MRSLVVLSLLTLSACDCGAPGLSPLIPDAGGIEGVDAGGSEQDAGPGEAVDGGEARADAGAEDAGAEDAGLDGGGTDAGTTTDAGYPIAIAPMAWVSFIRGPYYGTALAVGPSGDPVLAINTTSDEELVLGEGEPHELRTVDWFKPIVARYARADGRLLATRQLASDQSSTARGAAAWQTFVRLPNGDFALWGNFTYNVRVAPNSPVSRDFTAPTQTVGNTLHTAHDPYFLRIDESFVPKAVMRGRTPTLNGTTWFNGTRGLAALPDGGVVLAGNFERTGFILGDGQPGQVSLTAPSSYPGYLAAVSPNGSPHAVATNGRAEVRWLGTFDDGELATWVGAVPGGTVAGLSLDVDAGYAPMVVWNAALAPRVAFGFRFSGQNTSFRLRTWGNDLAVLAATPAVLELAVPDGGTVQLGSATNAWLARITRDGQVVHQRQLPDGHVANVFRTSGETALISSTVPAGSPGLPSWAADAGFFGCYLSAFSADGGPGDTRLLGIDFWPQDAVLLPAGEVVLVADCLDGAPFSLVTADGGAAHGGCPTDGGRGAFLGSTRF